MVKIVRHVQIRPASTDCTVVEVRNKYNVPAAIVNFPLFDHTEDPICFPLPSGKLHCFYY
jgi:hypothetical protein